MEQPAFRSLSEVIEDEVFPEVDLLLRAGHHIDDFDLDHFTFLEDARPFLEEFYDRFSCDLVRSVDGYYHLLPRGDRLGRRMLKPAEMLVGQALCLLRLDPGTLKTAWRIERVRVLELFDQLIGAERLGQVLNPRRKRRSKAVEEEEIRKDVNSALLTLARLGFVDIDGEQLRLRAPLLRFAEPVAAHPSPESALSDLIATGTVDVDGDNDDGEDE